MRWAGHITSMGRQKIRRGLGGKTKWKRPLGNSRHRWKENFKRGFKYMSWRTWAWDIFRKIRTLCGLLWKR